jgi:hypothetical protein
MGSYKLDQRSIRQGFDHKKEQDFKGELYLLAFIGKAQRKLLFNS